jgi:hypothetical protein
MKTAYRIAYEDYAEASRVLARLRRDPFRPVRICGYAAIASGIFFLANGPVGLSWLPAALLVALGLWSLVVPVWTSYGEVDRAWEDVHPRVEDLEIEATEHGLAFMSPTMDCRYQWQAFTRFLETRSLFLIFSGGQEAEAMIPKRSFGDAEEIAEFRQLLEIHLPGPAQGFPVVPK